MVRSKPNSAGTKTRRSALRFVVLFCVCVTSFYALTAVPLFRQTFFPAYLNFNAAVSADLLRLAGQNVTNNNDLILSESLSVPLAIRRGCDAVEPTGLFIAAILAFPASWKRKLIGAIGGTILLAALNLLRIISLYYASAYWPAAFETLHVDVWQPAFILVAMVIWILWARWALPLPATSGGDPARTPSPTALRKSP